MSNVSTLLSDLKLVNNTQVDLSCFNSLAPQVFSTPSTYSTIPSDIQFINQMGGQLFNYFSNPDPSTQKIWYIALGAGLTQAITDANNLIAIGDCQAIQKIIPSNSNE